MKQDFICAGELHFTANRTLYVNGDAGDNANPGTEEVPYRALQVAAGTYDGEQQYVISKSGGYGENDVLLQCLNTLSDRKRWTNS